MNGASDLPTAAPLSRAQALRRRSWWLAALVAVLATGALVARARAAGGETLRVCADPNALPFSNAREQGFENQLARLLARELGAKLEYTWWAQRRGFFRNTLKAERCDAVMGVPADLELVATTEPYYSASYAFVTRAELTPGLDSFDDPRLRSLRIGVSLVGDDGVNAPPLHALSARGIVQNVIGFSAFGDYSDPAQLAAPVRALERGELDVALIWAPVGGYFARHASRPLVVHPLGVASDHGIRQRFDIAVGTRKGDRALRDRLNVALKARRREIHRLLSEYGFTGTEGRP